MVSEGGAADPERSSLSTSSVDRFLRDHGFDLSSAGGLELSSLSVDSDGADATAEPAGGVSFQSASEEETPVTPRFTLLDAKDFDLAAAPPSEARSAVAEHEVEAEEQQSELMLDGSGFSGFSSGATDARSRIAQTQHEEGAVAAASALHQRTLSQVRRRDTATGSLRSSSQSSGASRVQDDELSDALGVTASTPERRGTRDGTSSARPPRPLQRSLFPAPEDEDEKEEKEEDGRPESEAGSTRRKSLERPPVPTASVSAAESRSSVSEADSGWHDLNDRLRKQGLPTITYERVDARSLGALTVPDHASVVALVQDVVLQLERKDEVRGVPSYCHCVDWVRLSLYRLMWDCGTLGLSCA